MSMDNRSTAAPQGGEVCCAYADEVTRQLYRDYKSPAPASLIIQDAMQEISDAIVLPHKGVFDSAHQFIDGTGLHEGMLHAFSNASQETPGQMEKAVYLGCFCSIWGHCLTDNLKRLWIFLEKYKMDLSGATFVYTVLDNRPLPKSFFELLSLIVPENTELVCLNTPTRIRCCLLPAVSMQLTQHGRIYSPRFTETVDAIRQKALQAGTYAEKIYLSRSRVKKQQVEVGEQEIEEIFRRLGYTVLYPEQLTLSEQINAAAHCKCFASTEGSVSHNAMFCQNGAKAVLIKKSCFINGYQAVINEMRGLAVTYIDAHLSVLVRKDAPWGGPFLLVPRETLKRFAADSLAANQAPLPDGLFTVDRKQFFSYLRLGIKSGGNVSREPYYDALACTYFPCWKMLRVVCAFLLFFRNGFAILADFCRRHLRGAAS